MDRLKILGRVTSINVRKVLWTADLIGIDYENVPWGLPYRDPKVAEFLALNPNGQVPVIIDGDFVLWESNAVVRYLAETRRSGLWPVTPRERALVDQWLTWQAAELGPRWGYAVNALLRRQSGLTDAARIAESVARWSEAMQVLEGHLAGSDGWLANGWISLADIAIALAAHRWFSTPFDRPGLPAVETHYRRLKETREGKRYLDDAIP